MFRGVHETPRHAASAVSRNEINGRHARACRPFLLAVLLFVSAQIPAQAAGRSLGSLQEMAAAGAPGLALSLMDEAQPAADDAPGLWAEWERVRIAILADAHGWQRAINRLRKPPPAAPESFRRWALARRAAFHLELDAPREARALLRDLLWNAGPGASEEELRAWRRLVVRSYLVGHDVDDAITALRRFDQDYPDTSPAWAILRTRVLLRGGRPREAERRLPDEGGAEFRALGLLARLRAETANPADIYEEAAKAAQVDEAPAVARARFWFVAAAAARAAESPARRALATEKAVALAGALPPSDTVFEIDGTALWQAWLEYATWFGNSEQLLIGDDDAWFAASQDARPKFPVRSRALLAVVAVHGSARASRRAHVALMKRLSEGAPGMAAARQLYLHADRFPQLDAIPESVRYRLVDDALARDDLGLATQLMTGLDEAPPDVGAFGWRLLRARVLVLGGRTDDGVAELDGIIGDYPDLSGKALDRFLQVVFDLQGAREDEAALELLRRLALRDLPGQRMRELLYWQAESHESLEHYRLAADLYMRSATLMDGKGGDQWGQTARYHAAAMLAKAGLVSDARRIYEQLLRVTQESGRRSTLRHRLQQLGLREAAPGNLPAPSESRQ